MSMLLNLKKLSLKINQIRLAKDHPMKVYFS